MNWLACRLILMFGLHCFLAESNKTFNVSIKERGTKFTERIVVNEAENLVVYKVPRHNDVDQSEILFDYALGKMATRVPRMKACYIHSIPREVDSSPESVKKSLKLYNKFPNKGSMRVKTVASVARTLRKLNKTEMASKIWSFCYGLDVYEIELYYQNKRFHMKRNGVKGKVKRFISFYGLGRHRYGMDEWGGPYHIRDPWGRRYSPSWESFSTGNEEWAKDKKDLCKKVKEYYPSLRENGCLSQPDKWKYVCRNVESQTCFYRVKCKPDGEDVQCDQTHFITSVERSRCCDVRCPSKRSTDPLSTPRKQPKQSTSTPTKQAKQSISTPTKQPKQSISTPTKQPKQSISTPTKQPKQSTSTPTKQPKQSISTPTKQPKQSTSTPTKQPKQSISTATQQPNSSSSTPSEQAGQSTSTPTEAHPNVPFL